MKRCTLIVVAKQPAPGLAKTRLCPPLDQAEAAGLAACFLRDTLDLARAVPAISRVIAYAPAEAEGYFRDLAPDMALTPQRGHDLGERLAMMLADAFAAGFGQAVALGADSPTLPAGLLADAFALLDSYDVVLGPADDGGYYLIGLTRPQPRLFREVVMSTPTVAADTLAIAASLGLRVALLPRWYDVDTAADLARLRAELERAPAEVARHTRGLLTRLSAQ